MPSRRPLLIVLAAAASIGGCSTGTSGSGSTHTSAAAPPATSAAATTAPAASSPAASSSARRPTHARTTRPTSTPPSSKIASAPSPPAVRGPVTVVLNPGHDGGNASHTAEINRLVHAGYGVRKACDTTGTSTNAGYPEHAFTWDVALRVRRMLQARGVRVIMTRPNDDGVGPCVDERAAIGNHRYVAAVVSIHADGAPASGHGFHVNQDSRRPEGATAAVASRSVALGRAIHTALVRSSGLVPSTYIGQNGYYYRDDLAGLNLARRPATFLELGNMRNAGDAQLLSSPGGRGRIAQAVADGILAYLGS